MTDQPDLYPLYLASIALEPNRWKSSDKKVPSLDVSSWSGQAVEAGFDGWELWEHHYFLAPTGEREALAISSCPVRIFNTYLIPGIDPLPEWERVVEAVMNLGPQLRAIKFNLGKAVLPAREQVRAAVEWAALLPASVRMLCECHPGTVLEDPQAARAAFKSWPADRFGAILHPMGTAASHCDKWFDALGGRIEHLHWQARGGDNRVCALRERENVLAVAMKSLRSHNFGGTQSVEFVSGTGQPDESVDGLFREAARDLKTLREAYRG